MAGTTAQGQLVAQQPYRKSQALTASDSTVYNPPLDAIYVGAAGNVTVVDEAGNTTLFTAPPVGAIIPISASKVKTTGTTATALVGLNY